MVITLIGYRGSGKSSVARLLATARDMSWIDSDDVIEERTGLSIREIFAQQGESEFRGLEEDVIRELTSRESVIIAAGGGAILSAENRRRMKEAGPVVWLQAGIQQLADRIAQDETTAERRPSLTGRSVAEEIEVVLTTRKPLYDDAATMTIDTDGQSLHQTVTEICRQLASEDPSS